MSQIFEKTKYYFKNKYNEITKGKWSEGKLGYFIIIMSLLWLISRIIISYSNNLNWDEAVYMLLGRHFGNYIDLSWQSHRPPGYPMIVFVWSKIFGGSFQMTHVLNWILYLVGFYFFYRFVKEVEGENIARRSIAIGFASPVMIYFGSASVMSESLLWLTTNAGLYFYVRFLKGKTLEIYAASIFFSIALFSRFTTFFYVIALVILPFQIGKETWIQFKKYWYHVLGAVILAVTIFIPWFWIWEIKTGSIIGPIISNLRNGMVPFNFLTFDWLLWFVQTPYIYLAITGIFVLHGIRGLLNKRSRLYIVWFVSHYLIVTFLRSNCVDFGEHYGGHIARLIFSGFPALFIITAISWEEKSSLVVNPMDKFQKRGMIINIGLIILYLILFGVEFYLKGIYEYFKTPLSFIGKFTIFWVIAALLVYKLIDYNLKRKEKYDLRKISLLAILVLLLPINLYYTQTMYTSLYFGSIRDGTAYIRGQSDGIILTNTLIVGYYTDLGEYVRIPETYSEFQEIHNDSEIEYVLIHNIGGMEVPQWFELGINSTFLEAWNSELNYVTVYQVNASAV